MEESYSPEKSSNIRWAEWSEEMDEPTQNDKYYTYCQESRKDISTEISLEEEYESDCYSSSDESREKSCPIPYMSREKCCSIPPENEREWSKKNNDDDLGDDFEHYFFFMISYPPKLQDFDGLELFLRIAREMISEFTPRKRKKNPMIYAIKAGNAITVIPNRMKKSERRGIESTLNTNIKTSSIHP